MTSKLIDIKTEDSGARAALDRLEQAVTDLTPAWREISEILFEQTMRNFDAQGRPPWQALAPATIRERTREGTWPGKILDRGRGGLQGLRGGIHAFSDAESAGVGVGGAAGAIYAAIQQFGGQAGRGLKVTIPARPYLPITAELELQPEADAAIVSALNGYLRAAWEG